MNVVQCNDLTKVYGRKAAVNNITVRIEENKITGLIGRNGAGKTTLLKMIAGYYTKSSGEVLVFNEDPFNNLQVSSNLIFIDDNMTFPISYTLKDILKTAATFYEHWDGKLATGLFNYFQLDKDQYHDKLSKGMKSTFNMIIGLSARCPLTIFDEPTTGMDAAVRKDFYRALLKDYLNHPRTMILSSHLLNEIEDVLEDVLLIKEGEKCLHLPIEQLKQYAVGLSGQEQAVTEATANADVIYQEKIGPNGLYVAVKNNYSDHELEQFKLKGIEVKSVSTTDVCVYLTNRNQGGIDDVFQR